MMALLLLFVEAAPPSGHAAEYAPHQPPTSLCAAAALLIIVLLREGNVVPPGTSRLEERAQIVDDRGGVAEVRAVVRLAGALLRPLSIIAAVESLRLL